MNDVLPDSTLWIDYFNPKVATPQKEILNALLVSHRRIYTCPPVYQEVLQGARNERDLAWSRAVLLKCRRGKAGAMQAANRAVEIYRDLRKRGITIRKPNDCLIAAYALLNDLAVLHNDRDFDPIQQYFGLKVVYDRRNNQEVTDVTPVQGF